MSRDVSNRSSIRIKVLLAAEVSIDDQPIPIRIRNVSRSGLAGDARRPPKVGTAVTFRRGTTVKPGQVVWANGQQFGIRFTAPLEEDELRLHFPQLERHGLEKAAQPLFRWGSAEPAELGRARHDRHAALKGVETCMEVMSSDGISVGFVGEVEEAGVTVIPHGQHQSKSVFLTARCVASVGCKLELCLRADELGIGS